MRRPLSSVVLLIACTACGSSSDPPSWLDQLVPDSPCYRVDLLDGLDESSTAELRDLYDCLNKHGHFEPLAPAVRALESSTSRDGDPAGLELVKSLNQMPSLDVDPFAIAGIMLDALRSPDVDLHDFLDVGLELIYGRPATEVRASPDGWNDLSGSVLTPLGDALPAAVTPLLDDDLEAVEWLGGVIQHPETKRWLRTASAYLESEDPAIRAPLTTALYNLGHARSRTLDASNDRHPGATGDSLRDLAQIYIIQPDPVLQAISAPVSALTSDPLMVQALETELVRLHSGGHLQALPAQIKWMAEVDLHGQPLTQGSEPSALHRFLRLLANTNAPMDCTIDLWLVQIPFSFGNLAVSVLEILATLDPDTVQDTAGIIALLTDNALADWMLHEAVDAGICPVLTHEVVDDLVAVDVVTEPPAYDLLTVVVRILHAARYDGSTNHIADIADAGANLHLAGGTEPLEELFRDIGDEPLLADLVEVVPILADPQAHGIVAGAEPAADIADALSLLDWAVSEDPDTGRTGLEWLRPILKPLLSEDGTWTTLNRAAGLMRYEDSATAGLLALIPPLLQLDPDLALMDQLGPLLGQRSVAAPLLRALEAPGVVDGLLTDTPEDGQTQAPTAFLGALIADGTFDDLLALVDLLLEDLGGVIDEVL